MKPELLNQIVEAMLYEGYILYPYRASAKKNRHRFSFGRVYPRAYSVAQKGLEPCRIQTECLARTIGERPNLRVSVRFLHLMAREVGSLTGGLTDWHDGSEPAFRLVPELWIEGEVFQTWQEAIEQQVTVPALALDKFKTVRTVTRFEFPSARGLEPIRDHHGRAAGVILRRQEALAGALEVSATPLEHALFRITVQVVNDTPMLESELGDAEAVTMRTLASTHTILQVEGAEFISLMGPPAEHQSAAAACTNIGTWPVLIGDEVLAERDTMLSSPIIVYDYPEIAPESPGPFFDGSEIDELLSLRILTLSDREKLEMRRVDAQARRLLERTEALSPESLLKMHGTMREVQAGGGPERPSTRPGSASSRSSAAIDFDDFFGANTRLKGASIGGVYVTPGDRVRLRPKGRADIIDLVLNGQTAIVEAVEQDLEKRVHLAVVLEKDPGKDLGLMRQPGHRFFYGVDEIEPLGK